MLILTEIHGTQRERLVHQVVQVMRRLATTMAGRVVIDRQTWGIRLCGDGPVDTHVRAAAAAADPERYTPIPGRDHVETLAQIGAFLDDAYALIEDGELRAALDALAQAASPSGWRMILGEQHPAVQAFDASIQEVYRLVARMLLHGIREPRVGVLGTDRLARSRASVRTRPLALAPDDRGYCQLR